jgi:hypothetical protein
MNIDYKLLKQLSEKLVLVKECGAKDAAVLGGCIRDMLLNKPIRDIDLFYTGTLDAEKVEKIFGVKKKAEIPKKGWFDLWKEHQLALKAGMLLDDMEKEYDYSVIDGGVVEEYPLQLIGVEELSYSKFPCKLSKVGFTELAVVCMSNDFLKSVEYQMLFFTENAKESYKNKLIEKYPEYEPVCE